MTSGSGQWDRKFDKIMISFNLSFSFLFSHSQNKEVVVVGSEIRIGRFIELWATFQSLGFDQISHILRQFLQRCQKFNFSSEIIFGQLLLVTLVVALF